jgi:hypothetical protein
VPVWTLDWGSGAVSPDVDLDKRVPGLFLWMRRGVGFKKIDVLLVVDDQNDLYLASLGRETG